MEANVTAMQLEQALEVSEKDVKDASAGVLKDLKRFQGQKEEDLRRYMVSSFLSLMILSVCPPLTQLCSDRVRKMPHRLGEEESRDLEGSHRRSREDSSAVGVTFTAPARLIRSTIILAFRKLFGIWIRSKLKWSFVSSSTTCKRLLHTL